MKRNLIISILSVLAYIVNAQETIDAYPLTDNILLVHIDEGEVIHPTNGQHLRGGTLFRNAVVLSEVDLVNNYLIQSNDDPFYGVGLAPEKIERKSKPTEFLNLCESWQYLPFYDRVGCKNENDHVIEHWLYLFLPQALQEGSVYNIEINSAVLNKNLTLNLIYEPAITINELIHVNNVGYSIQAPTKYGYLYGWIGSGGSLNLDEYINRSFQIINSENDQVVFNGSVQFRKGPDQLETYVSNPDATYSQNFNGTFIYECDFSGFSTPGIYYLSIEGIGRSPDFEIACDAMRKPFEKVMQGIFNNRSGSTLEIPYTENLRPAPHNPQETPAFQGRLKFTSTTICEARSADADFEDKGLWESGYVGDLENSWGWYQDAGDWDAYTRHYEVSSLLMFAYEYFPENFIDGQLLIPENDNGLPDILDEARWLPRFYLRLKDETETRGWTSGGVPGSRIFGDLWGDDLGEEDIVRGSWEDTDRDWYVSGEEVNMSFLYSAMCSHLAYLLQKSGSLDPENIDWLSEAIDAYNWANARHTEGATCQGYLVDYSKNYASACLYRITGIDSYHNDFITSWNVIPNKNELQGDIAFGAYVYQFTERPKDASILSEINGLIKSTARYNLFELGNDRGCRWGGNPFFPMLSGQPTTPYIIEGVVAAKLLEEENSPEANEMWKVIYNTADYFLGTNPLGMTWITGLGENSPTGILHLDSWATGDGSVKEGIVPYGPWRKQNSANLGAFSNEWPYQWVYPEIDLWPGHERWFNQRYSPLGSEFTINQNNATAAFVYGALSGNYSCTETVPVQDLKLDHPNKITVYPNPTPGTFRTAGELPFYEIKVVNILGQVVLTIPRVGNNYEIDLSRFENGVYYLTVKADNDKVFIKTVLKQ